jgi:hypothetical protein
LVRAPQDVDSGLSQKRNGALQPVFFIAFYKSIIRFFFGGFFNRSAFAAV